MRILIECVIMFFLINYGHFLVFNSPTNRLNSAEFLHVITFYSGIRSFLYTHHKIEKKKENRKKTKSLSLRCILFFIHKKQQRMEENMTLETEQSRLLNENSVTSPEEAEKEIPLTPLMDPSSSSSFASPSSAVVQSDSIEGNKKSKKKKKQNLDQKDEEIKFHPSIIKKYRALVRFSSFILKSCHNYTKNFKSNQKIWLNLNKLKRNYISSCCLQMVLPVAILTIPAVISGVILTINIIIMMVSLIFGIPIDCYYSSFCFFSSKIQDFQTQKKLIK